MTVKSCDLKTVFKVLEIKLVYHVKKMHRKYLKKVFCCTYVSEALARINSAMPQ